MHKLTSLLLALTILALAAESRAQEPSTDEPAAVAVVDGGPVSDHQAIAAEPAEPFDPDVATRAYLDRLTPEKARRSDSYFEGGYWLQLWGLLYGLVVAWLLLNKGLSTRMRDWAERITRRKSLQTILYTAQYVILTTALFFPLTAYQDSFASTSTVSPRRPSAPGSRNR